jgi:hypothetical protein
MTTTTVRMQRIDDHIVIDVDDLLKMLVDLTRKLDGEREKISREIVGSWHMSDQEKAEKMQEAVMTCGAAGELEILTETLERWKADEIRVSDQEEGGAPPTSCDGCHYNQKGRCEEHAVWGPAGADLPTDRYVRGCYEGDI